MNNAWSLHCLLQRQYYLWQTSSDFFLPEDRCEKFYTFFASTAVLRKHNYSWKLFRVAKDQKFFFFNLNSFNLPLSLGPEIILWCTLWILLITLLLQETRNNLSGRRNMVIKHVTFWSLNCVLLLWAVRTLHHTPFNQWLELIKLLSHRYNKRNQRDSASQLINAFLWSLEWKYRMISQF